MCHTNIQSGIFRFSWWHVYKHDLVHRFRVCKMAFIVIAHLSWISLHPFYFLSLRNNLLPSNVFLFYLWNTHVKLDCNIFDKKFGHLITIFVFNGFDKLLLFFSNFIDDIDGKSKNRPFVTHQQGNFFFFCSFVGCFQLSFLWSYIVVIDNANFVIFLTFSNY